MLECWHAYQMVPDVDITAVAYGSARRWDSLFPHSTAGFVPLVPLQTRQQLEQNSSSWCARAFETDANDWAEFGDLHTARDAITAELLRQRERMMIVVEPARQSGGGDTSTAAADCYWQLLRGAPSPGGGGGLFFLLLFDSRALTPANQTVLLRLGRHSTMAAGAGRRRGGLDVFDQLGSSPSSPIGHLSASAEGEGAGEEEEEEGLQVHIPAGSARFLTLRER
jgi:hypothetical protein